MSNLLAVSVLQTARHVSVDGSLDDAVALLTTGDGVVAEGVLLAGGTRVVGRAGHVRGADAFAVFLVALRRRGTFALFAVRETEESGFAAGAGSADDVGLAFALPADFGAVIAEAAFGIAAAVDGAPVEVGG